MDLQSQLSRRERQIMDIIYARGEASISQVREELPDPPARGAVGRMIRILEDKGHLRHYQKGREFIFRPTVPRRQAGPSALRRVVDTFFGGSAGKLVVAAISSGDLSAKELAAIKKLLKDKEAADERAR